MGCSYDNNISTKGETNSDNSSLSNLSKNQKIKKWWADINNIRNISRRN